MALLVNLNVKALTELVPPFLPSADGLPSMLGYRLHLFNPFLHLLLHLPHCPLQPDLHILSLLYSSFLPSLLSCIEPVIPPP